MRPVAATAVALAVAGFAGGCGGSDGRSAQAFCAVIDDAVDDMRANVTGVAADDALGNLGAGFENLGRYTVMVERLADVAPDEIRTEMEAAAEAWSAQAEAMGQAASDPLGALGAGLAGLAFSSGFYAAVDEYANDTCGTRVFSF